MVYVHNRRCVKLLKRGPGTYQEHEHAFNIAKALTISGHHAPAVLIVKLGAQFFLAPTRCSISSHGIVVHRGNYRKLHSHGKYGDR